MEVGIHDTGKVLSMKKIFKLALSLLLVSAVVFTPCTASVFPSSDSFQSGYTAEAVSKLQRPEITAKVKNSARILVSWSKIPHAEKYYVYRSTSKSGTYTKIATVSGTCYSNYIASPGATYYYKVRAAASGYTTSSYSYYRSAKIPKDSACPLPDKSKLIRADVVSIVDGDTIWVIPEGSTEKVKVRFIGIDTPESVHSDPTRNCPEGKTASNKTRLIIGQAKNIVYLEYDLESRDKYERELCYIYLKSGKSYIRLQDTLLKMGMCRTMTIQPNSRYADYFAGLQTAARKSGVGFWKDYYI